MERTPGSLGSFTSDEIPPSTRSDGLSRQPSLVLCLLDLMTRVRPIFNSSFAMIALFCTLLFAACKEESEIKRIQDLEREKTQLQEELRRCQHHEGYWVMSVPLLVISAGVLFCVGLAVGMGIKKSVLRDGQ
jgi:hypothetical protein